MCCEFNSNSPHKEVLEKPIIINYNDDVHNIHIMWKTTLLDTWINCGYVDTYGYRGGK